MPSGNSFDSFLAPLLLILVIFILVQLALRWFNCWYWKINHRLHALEDMSAALQRANQTLQETNRAMQDIRVLLLTQHGQVPVNPASTPAPPPMPSAAPTPPPSAPVEDNIPNL